MGSAFSSVYKDVLIVRRLGKIAKVKLPINNCSYHYYKYAMDRGEGEEDFSRIILKMEDKLTK